MMKKRLFAAFCVLLALITVSAGCKNERTANQTTTAGNTSSEETAPEEFKVAYPFKTDKPITLSYWVPFSGSAAKYISSYSENEAMQEIMKNTGVNIEFLHPAAGQAKEQFNLLIASGDLPDIIGQNPWGPAYYKGGSSAGVEDGVFVDLMPYLPTYAPDFYNMVMSDEKLFRDATDDEGNISAFFIAKTAFPPFRRFAVRTDVIEELGIQYPKLLADYENMFEKMKNAGITPYCPNGNGYEIQLQGMFDVVNGFYKDENNNIKYGQIEQGFKEYLEMMNDWFDKGYISKDFMSITWNDRGAMFDNKELGLHMNPVDLTYTRAQAGGYEFMPLPYPKKSEGQQLHIEKTTVTKRQNADTVVTTQCENIEVAVQFLNYFYTEEGSRIACYGVEGKSWNMVDGKPQFTEYMLNNEKIDRSAAQDVLKLHAIAKKDDGIICNPNVVANQESLSYRMMHSDDETIDNHFILPPFNLAPDENAERASIMAEVNTYVDEMVLKFITGAAPLSDFDKFVSTVKSLDIDRAIELTQDAYNRYLNKKLPPK